jgi:hypothetical protein
MGCEILRRTHESRASVDADWTAWLIDDLTHTCGPFSQCCEQRVHTRSGPGAHSNDARGTPRSPTCTAWAGEVHASEKKNCHHGWCVCACVCARVRLRSCLRRTWSWGAATWLPSQSAALTCTHMLCVNACVCIHKAGNTAQAISQSKSVARRCAS